MSSDDPIIQYPLFLRFYARCFLFPYEEMGYELQHLFRQLERQVSDEQEASFLEQILTVINQYQGEDIKNLRENFVLFFGHLEGSQPLCSLLASEFMQLRGKRYTSDGFEDLLLDSDIPVDPEAPLDSIVNYLEYLSVLMEEPENKTDLDDFIKSHIMSWIPLFCDVLYQASPVSFYKEVAVGLRNLLAELAAQEV